MRESEGFHIRNEDEYGSGKLQDLIDTLHCEAEHKTKLKGKLAGESRQSLVLRLLNLTDILPTVLASAVMPGSLTTEEELTEGINTDADTCAAIDRANWAKVVANQCNVPDKIGKELVGALFPDLGLPLVEEHDMRAISTEKTLYMPLWHRSRVVFNPNTDRKEIKSQRHKTSKNSARLSNFSLDATGHVDEFTRWLHEDSFVIPETSSSQCVGEKVPEEYDVSDDKLMLNSRYAVGYLRTNALNPNPNLKNESQFETYLNSQVLAHVMRQLVDHMNFRFRMRGSLEYMERNGASAKPVSVIPDWVFLKYMRDVDGLVPFIPVEVKSIFNLLIGTIGVHQLWMASVEDVVALVRLYTPDSPSEAYGSLDQVFTQIAAAKARFGFLYWGLMIIIFAVTPDPSTGHVKIRSLVLDQRRTKPTLNDIVQRVVEIAHATGRSCPYTSVTEGDQRRMTPQKADDTFGSPAEPSCSNPFQQPGCEGDTGKTASHTQSTGYSSNRKRSLSPIHDQERIRQFMRTLCIMALPWIGCGRHGPVAKTILDGVKVVIKAAWDPALAHELDAEAAIYDHLGDLTDDVIPVLYATSEITAMVSDLHALVLQYVGRRTASDLSTEEWKSSQAATRIEAAFSRVWGAGVLHGDIKPENVVMSDEDCRPMIIDFGFARTRRQNESEKDWTDAIDQERSLVGHRILRRSQDGSETGF